MTSFNVAYTRLFETNKMSIGLMTPLISSETKIVLVYHDDFIDYDDGTSTMVVNHVAENFDDFLNLLHE